MFPWKFLMIGLVSVGILVMTMSPGISAERHKDRYKERKEKQAFPQTAIINKLYTKTVCGRRDPGARFVTSKNGKEVCDRATGEIWEQNPMSEAGRGPMTQADAIAFCESLDKGHGPLYELPSIQQLGSVLDYTIAPPGPVVDTAVFTNVLSSIYWSRTPFAGPGGDGWGVLVGSGVVDFLSTGVPTFVWCVRRDHDAHADW